MAIAVTPTPSAWLAKGDISCAFTGLAATTTYLFTCVGPNGTESHTATSSGGGAATVVFHGSGKGTYTLYTTVISAAAAVPAGSFTVPGAN